jgi:hypothetical protein
LNAAVNRCATQKQIAHSVGLLHTQSAYRTLSRLIAHSVGLSVRVELVPFPTLDGFKVPAIF